MADWVVEPLDRAHQRAEFCCGKSALDAFLTSLVSQYEKRRLGRTYVAVQSGGTRVFGYYTISSGAVAFENLPADGGGKLPRHPVPVILLARLAVDRNAQGAGLGRLLLMDALSRCLSLSEQLGVYAVEVDAIDAEAKNFYLKYGFVPLHDNALHLYMPIATIRDAFEQFDIGQQ